MRRPPWIRKNTTAGMTLTLSGLKPRKRLAEIAELRQERNAKKTRIRLFMENMNSHQELVQSFDEELWYSTVDYVTVYEDKRLVFTFRDGRQVEITAELWRAA